MEPLIMAGLGFLILLPILYMLPLGMDIKGKLILAVAALLLSMVWIAAQPLIESWKIILVILLMSGLGVYFLDKKLGHWFSRPLQEREDAEEYAGVEKEETPANKEAEGDLEMTQPEFVNNQAMMLDTVEDQQTYIDEEVQLLTEQQDDELAGIADTDESKHPDYDVEEIVTDYSNAVTDEEVADDYGTAFEMEEISVIELSDKSSMTDDQDMAVRLDDGESELLQRDFDAFLTTEVESTVNDARLTLDSASPIEAELIDRDLGSLEDDAEDPGIIDSAETSTIESQPAFWELEDLEELLLEKRDDKKLVSFHQLHAMEHSVRDEAMDGEGDPPIWITEEQSVAHDGKMPIESGQDVFPEALEELTADEEGVAKEADGSVSETVQKATDDEEVFHPPIPSASIQRELFSLMIEEVRMMEAALPPVGYEALIRQYMDADLPDEEQFTFARLLLDHFIMQKEYDKLTDCLVELEPRYKRYPVLAAEIDYLKTLAKDQ